MGVVRGAVHEELGARRATGHDESHLVGLPSAVVVPADAEDVRSLVLWARAHKVPLVPRGAGTSLDGESVPEDGAVVVDLGSWQAIGPVAEEERVVRVQPGVVNLALQAATRPFGLFFPPNPGSWTRATIGGQIGTNASGPRSFRYGPTRAWVREVEVVLGTGARMRLGTRAAKRSVGPELLPLLFGSEGTLGIVTEATVRLAPIPPVRRGLVVPLPDGVRLGSLAARLARAPVEGLSAVEYVDRASAAALAALGRPIGPGDAAWLLLEVEAPGPADADRRAAELGRLVAAAGAAGPPIPFDDADELWTRRGESSTALDRQIGQRIREDVAVPLAEVDALLDDLARIAAEEGAPLFLFAHLGEGSLHPNFAVDPSTPAADRVRARTLTAALARGGTISAEHGIGRLKRSFVERELGADAAAWLGAVKRWCDPDGILNPGKLYPPTGGDARSSRSP